MSVAFAAPGWLHALSVATLLLGASCSLLLSAQVIRHPQHMMVMNVVWPVCALFGTIAVVWAYLATAASPRWRLSTTPWSVEEAPEHDGLLTVAALLAYPLCAAASKRFGARPQSRPVRRAVP